MQGLRLKAKHGSHQCRINEGRNNSRHPPPYGRYGYTTVYPTKPDVFIGKQAPRRGLRVPVQQSQKLEESLMGLTIPNSENSKPSLHKHLYLSIYRCIYLPVSQSTCLAMHLSTCLPIYLPAYLCDCLSIHACMHV